MEISTFFLAGMVGAYGVLHHLVFLGLSIFVRWGGLEEEENEETEKPFSIRNEWELFNYDFGYAAGQSFGYVAIYALLSYWLVGQWATWDLSIAEIKYNGLVIHTPTMILFALLSAAAGASWIGGSFVGDSLGIILAQIFDAVFKVAELIAKLTGRENTENTAGIILLLLCLVFAILEQVTYNGTPILVVTLTLTTGFFMAYDKLQSDKSTQHGLYKMGLFGYLTDKYGIKTSLHVKKILYLLVFCSVICASLFLIYLWVGLIGETYGGR